MISRKPKKQRANSFDDFGRGILDKEDENDSTLEIFPNTNIQLSKRQILADNRDMIDVQAHNQLPTALIPPTSLHLDNIALNRN